MKLQTSSFKNRPSYNSCVAALCTSQPLKCICLRLGPWNFFEIWSLKFGVFLWCLALGPGCLPGRAADPNTVLDAWFAAQTNLHTWTADFVQTRTLKTLTQPLVVNGRLVFAAPHDFRWELGRPARTMALRNGDEMFVVYPLLKRAERYSLGTNTPQQWRDTMSLLQAGFPHDRREFEAQFQLLSLTETNGDWRFALQPKSAFARQMMPELRLRLATNDFSLAGTELMFVDGSSMRSDFTNAVVNPPLDSSLFRWTPPADFKITSPFDK
jgi:outer membrane lipoprotein-sorting protein